MSAFADTNWLEAIYFRPSPAAPVAVRQRHEVVERRMRRLGAPLLTSHIVLLEARNVFGRLTGLPRPAEWDRLLNDFNLRIFVDPMNWDLLRQETLLIFEKFSHKAVVGTFDATLVASALLAGARELLSFDEHLKGIAHALGLKVFPELGPQGKAFLAELRN